MSAGSSVLLTELLTYLRNFFEDVPHRGTFSVSGGVLTGTGLEDVPAEQYCRIQGSVYHDGVWQGTENFPSDLPDETFTGTVTPLRIPQAVLSLAEEIAAWQTAYGGAASSPYRGEKLGDYSYTKASSGTASGWTAAFWARLAPWRKL